MRPKPAGSLCFLGLNIHDSFLSTAQEHPDADLLQARSFEIFISDKAPIAQSLCEICVSFSKTREDESPCKLEVVLVSSNQAQHVFNIVQR